MQKINKEMTLGQIVNAIPAASKYFNKKQIDYCCGGARSLADAALEINIAPALLVTDLEQLAKDAADEKEMLPQQLASEKLADHIEFKHHQYMRQQMPLISELLDAVMRAHGMNHPELFELHKLYSQLRGELEQHLVKEEIRLFPGYQKKVAAQTEDEKNKAAHVIMELREEHEAAGDLLHQMRQLTQQYQVPEDGCTTYHRLFKNLEELEADLFEHIHLENNILFNREVGHE